MERSGSQRIWWYRKIKNRAEASADLECFISADRPRNRTDSTGGDTKFGMICDTVTLWCVTVPLGALCAFAFKLPAMVVYFVLNLDEIIKLPAVFIHYRKYKWVKNITLEQE